MAIPESLRGQLRLPVIGSPLFIVSNPRLVIEQCKAGVIGSFPALNARPAIMPSCSGGQKLQNVPSGTAPKRWAR